VLDREPHTLLDELAEATLEGTRKEHMQFLVTVPLLIIDDLGMRKLPLTADEELLEIIIRRYERASPMLTSKPSSGSLGQTAGRRRRGQRPARPRPAPRTRAQVRSAQLENQDGRARTIAVRLFCARSLAWQCWLRQEAELCLALGGPVHEARRLELWRVRPALCWFSPHAGRVGGGP
jgi:IstB-like ATP binding protein